MEYITTKEASAKWGISTIRITVLANEGRIPGAYRLGKSWLIPSNATKPEPRKANHSGFAQKETDNFTFPLYHFRPDWNPAKDAGLSKQQQCLLQAENTVLECRFADAYPLLMSILHAPDDITTEIGCLWNAGICCIALNKSKDFSRIYLRLQMLIYEDFSHRDDLVIILDFLKTYTETLDYAASHYTYNTNIHDQCLPLTCVLNGYAELARETLHPTAATISLLELNLRLLKTTGSVLALEFMHCHLLGIYYIHENIEEAEKHAKAAIQIAYENKLYLPLVSYFRYYAQFFSPILTQYPEDFQSHCHELFSQYEENFTAFLSSINEHTIFTKLTNADFPYTQGVFMGLTNDLIAEKLGVSKQTVKRRLARIYEMIGVSTKKELIEYMHNYM